VKEIKVELKDGARFEGLLLSHPKFVVIKLKNGYNVALSKDEISKED